jgi:TM2 domain-containing membrane protein YozV
MAKTKFKTSSKNWNATLILCLFFGYLGIHRFYAGRIKSGILWLVTGGLLGLGYIIDLILIATFRFKDRNGHKIS